jgi:hypothetical protein
LFGLVLPTEEEVKAGFLGAITKGFHSYTSQAKATQALWEAVRSPYKKSWELGLMKCIIPEGTKYFRNKRDKEYCSKVIIPKNLIAKNLI